MNIFYPLSTFFILFLISYDSIAQAFYTFRGTAEVQGINYQDDSIQTSKTRAFINVRQKIKYRGTSRIALGAEVLYFFDPSTYEKSEIRIRDTFYEFEGKAWNHKIGYQSINWSETFGVSYTDFINHRDLRYGPYFDLKQSKLDQLMYVTNYTNKYLSWDIAYVPLPRYNLLPAPNTLHFPRFVAQNDLTIFNVEPETGQSGGWTNGDWATRLSSRQDDFDLGVSFFSYTDRDPWYRLNLLKTSATNIYLLENHSRTQSGALSFAKDFDGYVLRSDAMMSWGKVLNTVDDSGLNQVTVRESVYVASIDLPTWKSNNISLQWTDNSLNLDGNFLTRKQVMQFFGTRWMHTTATEYTWEFIATQAVKDSSNLFQLRVQKPVNDWLEASISTMQFVGTPKTTFGSLSKSNQVFISIKSYFSGYPSRSKK